MDCNGKKQGEAIAKIAIGLCMDGKIPDDVEVVDDRNVRVPISKIVGQSANWTYFLYKNIWFYIIRRIKDIKNSKIM